jgi:hypothetical protein
VQTLAKFFAQTAEIGIHIDIKIAAQSVAITNVTGKSNGFLAASHGAFFSITSMTM